MTRKLTSTVAGAIAAVSVAAAFGCNAGAAPPQTAKSSTAPGAKVAPAAPPSTTAPQTSGNFPAGPGRPFPDTTSRIAILADQLPGGMTAAQTQFVATRFVGSQKLTLPISQSIRALAPNFIVLHYHLAMWQSAPNVTFILDGTTWSNDYPTVTQNPSWFWLDASGNRVASTADGKLLMNVSDPGFQGYWASSIAQEIQLGDYDGVFLDSASPSLLQGETTDPQLAGTNASTTAFAELGGQTWSQAWNAWIAGLDASLSAQPRHPVLIPNVGSLITSWDKTNYGLTDGVFSEGYLDPSFATSDWRSAASQLVALVAAGKIVMLQNYLGDPNDVPRRLYFLANYLLLKGARTYLDYFAAGPLEWYPEWSLDLGTAQKTAQASIDELLDPSGLYRRDFQKGVVLVNPTSAPITVALGATFQEVVPQGGGAIPASGVAPGSVATTPVNQVTLAAASAAVLLR
jgi:hypothetical protein